MSSLKLTSVNKSYPSGETALYDINLQVEDNELLVITGGEACGKSTLLRIIAGLEDLSSGNIFIDGKDVTDESTKDRDVTMMFKNVSLDPSLTVEENLGYGLKIRKTPKSVIDVRVNAVAGLLGLKEVMGRKPKALTAAAKQRIAIGRALVREPEAYLFDEPLAGMDDNLRKDMLNVIASLQSRMKKPFVYATKNLSEALTVGTRIAVLKNGILQQVDIPLNLYDYPANAYVAFFIGSPTINFVKGAKIVKEGDGYFAEFEGGKLALSENIVNRFEKIEEYAAEGKTVILGIRPEDALIKKEGGDIKVKVTKCDLNGDSALAECVADKTILVAKTSKELLNGENAEISVDTAKLQIFDSATRLTLLSRDDGYKKTDFAEAGYMPLPYDEEQALIKKIKQKK